MQLTHEKPEEYEETKLAFAPRREPDSHPIMESLTGEDEMLDVHHPAATGLLVMATYPIVLLLAVAMFIAIAMYQSAYTKVSPLVPNVQSNIR